MYEWHSMNHEEKKIKFSVFYRLVTIYDIIISLKILQGPILLNNSSIYSSNRYRSRALLNQNVFDAFYIIRRISKTVTTTTTITTTKSSSTCDIDIPCWFQYARVSTVKSYYCITLYGLALWRMQRRRHVVLDRAAQRRWCECV